MTLGWWRIETAKALGAESAAVDYLDEKIAKAPEHADQEVPGDDSSVRAMLLQIHADGADRAKRLGNWTREQETARARMATAVQNLVGAELRSGAMVPWQIGQVLRAAALTADTPSARRPGKEGAG